MGREPPTRTDQLTRHTDRLTIRPLAPDDVDALLAYRSRPDVCRYVPFEPQNRETLTTRLTSDYAPGPFEQDGDRMTLGVVLRESGALIGDITLMHGDADHGLGEIGWMLNPACGGEGYATEAAAAGIDLLVGTLGIRRVVARIDARNSASIRLAQRLGMRQEAHFVENERFKGEWTDEVDFAILAHEWLSA